MEILKIHLSRLRNEEWFNLYTDLLELLEPLHGKADALLLVNSPCQTLGHPRRTPRQRR
jgi:hypothetical protein